MQWAALLQVLVLMLQERKGWRAGKLSFALHGDKLQGRWALVRMGKPAEDGKENWLLIKEDDDAAQTGRAAAITELRPESVKDLGDAAPAGKLNSESSRDDDAASTESDMPDKVEMLREFDAGSDHGVHAILKTPDGKGLYLISGNNAVLKEGPKAGTPDSSPVAKLWGDDHLLPRMPDGRGHNRHVMAPGGIVYRFTPDGKTFEIFASGFRNIYDGGVNRDGELFVYDADMEYDFNTSWYRPTRINHVVSGAEFGWRNGAGKYPEFYIDNLPATLNIGPGSPTGVAFGTGAKFPEKYQRALFISDWSYGKLYAVHLTPQGSTYSGTFEEFLSGTPLPLTDVIINPVDGAMYFAIGGRRTQSGLYRVTYTGSEPTAEVKTKLPSRASAVSTPFHTKRDSKSIAAIAAYPAGL